MPDYRIFIFEGGRIVAGRELVAADDGEAIEKGRDLAADAHAELWSGDRKVETYNEATA